MVPSGSIGSTVGSTPGSTTKLRRKMLQYGAGEGISCHPNMIFAPRPTSYVVPRHLCEPDEGEK